VNPNDVLTYTLRFTNTTGTPLSAAVVTASVPMSVSVIAASVAVSGVVEANQIRWTLALLKRIKLLSSRSLFGSAPMQLHQVQNQRDCSVSRV